MQGFDMLAWEMNLGLDSPEDGQFEPATPYKASLDSPDNCVTVVTYNDQPNWTINAQNLKLTMELLKTYGYTAGTYTDPNTEKPVFVFSGTFYYAYDGKPVESLYRSDSGGIVIDERMFSGGKSRGSQLKVTYIYNAADKRWLRTQEAIIPPNCKSPIHLSSVQIPNKGEAPFTYTSADAASQVISPILGGGSFTLSADTGAAVNRKSALLSSNMQGSLDKGSLPLLGDGRPTSGQVLTYPTSYYEYQGGLKFTVPWKWENVSFKTYANFTISIASAVGGSMVKSQTAVKGLSKYVDTSTGRQVEGMLLQWMKLSKDPNLVFKGISQESLVAAGITYRAGQLANAVLPDKTFEDVSADQRKEYENNMKYWGKVLTAADNADPNDPVNNFSSDVIMAQEMNRRTANMMTSLTELEAAIDGARNQDNTTSTVTGGGWFNMSNLSLVVSCIPKWGAVGSVSIDGLSFVLSGISDCRKAEIAEKIQKYLEDRDDYLRYDAECKRVIVQDEEWREQYKKDHPEMVTKTRSELCGKDLKNDPMGHVRLEREKKTGQKITPNHDPSGIVYEAVLSNGIEDATVTLYRYNADEQEMELWDDSEGLGQENPLTSDPTGYYRWDVPEGEWYVTAVKDGYMPGSSEHDVEATVEHNGTHYLPVLPPQLTVHIPLVSYEAPAVESAEATEGGIQVTFTKYMDESTLTGEYITLDGSAADVTLLDSEQAPDNIVYEGEAPRYTRTIRVACDPEDMAGAELRISGFVRSYAGVTMAAPYGNSDLLEGSGLSLAFKGLAFGAQNCSFTAVLRNWSGEDVDASVCAAIYYNGRMVATQLESNYFADAAATDIPLTMSWNYSVTDLSKLAIELICFDAATGVPLCELSTVK